MRLKWFHQLLFIALLFASPQAYSEKSKQAPLPSPLDLGTAISFAKDHPRTRLTLEQQMVVPVRQPLFLDCHDLTFNNTRSIDNYRNSITSNLINPVEQQKLTIMQHFFDVLLADSSLIGVNEDMAGAFIAYDRAKTRQEYKQYSEITVAKLEAEYQKVRQQFFSSEATQRLTRSQLAQTINHPEDLSSELNPPTLIELPKKLPDAEDVYTQSLKNNAWINTLKDRNNDDQMRLIEMDLRQQVLELLLRLRVLAAAKERSEAESYRRDLNLELSRALYEMEVKASLGRSMTLQSKARMNEERLNYCQNLAWAQLNALQGLDIFTPPKPVKSNNPE